METSLPVSKELEEKEDVVIRFCGDSGDGMQLTGTQFTHTTAVVGNDLSTLPDYPAEIRAPAGSLAGVSGYQIHFSSRQVRTPGDVPDVLVAMNPAALKANLSDLREGGIVIVNVDAFTPMNLKKAGYTSNPLEDGTVSKKYALYTLPITTLNGKALEGSPLSKKEVERCKNFFALGLMLWMYSRPLDVSIEWIERKFGNKPDLAEANKKALKGGFHYGETTDVIKKQFLVPKAKLAPGTYRNLTGNEAAALGLVVASHLAKTQLLYASYPITPASDILHELSRHKGLGVKTCQVEDEIAAAGVAVGAAFAGAISVTGTSGPGLALKSETISLGIMMELPMVIIDVQRGGPSTGLPTKTEQADLMQALYGRHGESPLAVLAAATPGDCFTMAIEAVRLAVRYMTPVILLTDGYLANSAEPWKIPDIDTLPPIPVVHPTSAEDFLPYSRNERTLSRPWAIPGTPGLEHRLGGLEKDEKSGNVSYSPENHERMVRLRQEKIDRMSQDIPPVQIFGEEEGEILVVGWGGTYGAITSAVEILQKEGLSVSSIHLRYLNPFPANLQKVLEHFETIIVPELNLGQLATLLRSRFLVNAKPLTKVQGKPFKVQEIINGIKKLAQRQGVKSWQERSSASPN